MNRGEVHGRAAMMVKLQQDQRIKIDAVTDAIMDAYNRGLADGRRDCITLSLDSALEQSDQA